MRNANKLLVTGLVIAAASGSAEAIASPGGVSLTTTPAGAGGLPAVKSSENSPAAQQHDIEKEIATGDNFPTNVLEARRENAMVHVADKDNPGEFIVNPLVIELGDRIISYAGRQEDELYIIPAGDAKVTTQIGHHTFTVKHPEAIVTPRVLHAVPDTGASAVGFTDAGEKPFGVMP